MLDASLVQITISRFPPALVVALVVVVFVSALALVVSLRIARRIRAIGDLGRQAADDETADHPQTSDVDG